MNFPQSLKCISLFILTWQCCCSFAFVSMRSEEISGKMDDILPDPKKTSEKAVQAKPPIIRSDEFSIFDENMEDMPEYKGGLLKGLLSETERKKKHNRRQKSRQEKPPQKDVHSRQDSKRVRRAVTNPQVIALRSSYTAWGSWSECSSESCTIEGSQIRYRSCYTFDSSQMAITDCSYENLAQRRGCHPESCSPSYDARWSKWHDWTPCDITCGKGGSQSRFRICLGWNGTEFVMTSTKCNGDDRENKPCQSQSNCPQWDDWSEWSQCSESCGEDGVTIRKRNCVYYKYHVTTATDQTLMHEFSGSHEENGRMVAETIDHPTLMTEANDDHGNSSSSDVNEAVKETVDLELCLHLNDNSVEKRKCNSHSKCSLWTTWGVWSKCHRRCAPGFRRRERECNKNKKNDPCTGGDKTQYRRCYPPPCWGPWTMIGSCSTTCGNGQQKRIRKCKIYAHTHPFNKCQGEEKDTVECNRLACDNFDSWSEWSPFTHCSATCGFRGVKFRNRICQADKCHGLSHEAEPCNRQRCPIWGRWGPLSCCHASCGSGFSMRTRQCIFGSNCRGEHIERHQCFSKPCEKPANNTLDGQKCGIRSKSAPTRPWLKILNGKNAAPRAWPWQGSWQQRENTSTDWKHFCGVSLIHTRWVITAGHCYDRAGYLKPYNLRVEVPPRDSWSVLFGVNDIRNKGIRYFIYKIYVHKQYKVDNVASHDVALLKLTSFVTLSDKVSPICLPGIQSLEPGQLCMATGWGQTKPGSQYSSILLEAAIPYIHFDDCRLLGKEYRDLREDIHICAGMTKGNVSDTCEGDSGGPLACKNGDTWYLAGITSFSFFDCGTPGHVGVYANVTRYQDWINETIEKLTYDNC